MVFDWRCPSVRSNSARNLGSFTFLGPKAAVCWVLWHLVSLQGEAKWMVASRASVCFAHMVKIWWKRTSSVTKTEINTQQLFFPPVITHTQNILIFIAFFLLFYNSCSPWSSHIQTFKAHVQTQCGWTSVTFLCDRLELRGLVWCVLFNL